MNVDIASVISSVSVPVALTVGNADLGKAYTSDIGTLVLPFPFPYGSTAWQGDLARILREAADEIERPTSD